jgi:hypothetical protein
MKNIILPCLLALGAASVFGNTVLDNFSGTYDPYWYPLGNPNTATYGETFTAPSNGDSSLDNFGFYMAGPFTEGDIIMSAYVATWTGTNAGTLLFTSSPVDYANTGNAFLSFNTGGLQLTPGASYVIFLSVSESYGQSSGESYVSTGTATIPGGSFVYYNNSGDFSALFSQVWDAIGETPDWAVHLEFSPGAAVPEPGAMVLLGTGLAAVIGAARHKRNRA